MKLYDQGLTTIQVIDNGTGVPKSCRTLMATKHATSKLRTFGDLYGESTGAQNEDETSSPVSTLGFRGEALFSLANISQSLVVSTRTEEETAGEEISFDSQGNVMEDTRRPIARGVGTTVSVHGLFERLPVRRVDLCKRIKNQRMKLMKILHGCKSNGVLLIMFINMKKLMPSLCEDATLCLGAQFQLIDVNTSKAKLKSETVKLATSDSTRIPTLETRVASILGTKVLNGLGNVEIDVSSVISDDSSSWKIHGLVSHSPASPHPSTARETHLFSINGRPVDLPNVSRLIVDVWRSFDSEGGRRPACILAFTLPNHAFDVNLSPDKRQVMFTEESSILGLIREGLSKHWAAQSEGRFEANEVETRSNIKKNTDLNDAIEKSNKEVFNKITPKSDRKKSDDGVLGASSSPNELASLAATDKAAITPTVTQTQSDGVDVSQSIDKCPEEEEEDATEATGRHEMQPTKSNHKELKAWEQMKLNFNRINKSHQQKELDLLLSPDSSNRKEPEQSSTESTLSINPTSRRRQRTSAASFLDHFAYGTAKSNTKTAEMHADSNSNRPPPADASYPKPTHQRPEQSTDEADVSNRPKPMARGCYGLPLGGNVQGSKSSVEKSTESDDEECDDEPPKVNMTFESISRRKARAQELAGKSGKMISGKRIISPKQLRSMQGRARESTVTQSSTISTLASAASKSNSKRVFSNMRGDNEVVNNTVWSSFSGTQSVISQSRHSQVLMRKRRKLLQQFVEPERDAAETKTKNDAKSVVDLCKEDFLHMSIIGQFNLGFILARCRNNNLWMLDQHACDEKFNFEKLCKETVIHEQKLITPLQLELSPSEEHCVLEHMDVFERNGFRFDYDPEKEPRLKLSLTALPHSGSGGDGTKPVQFGPEGMRILFLDHLSTHEISTHLAVQSTKQCFNLIDVGALCAMLGADGASDGTVAGFGTGADGRGVYTSNAVRRFAGSALGGEADNQVIGSSIIRLPKAIAMFASRACRVSLLDYNLFLITSQH